MEKFAVDLDKVLDDFELDEDENIGSSQFGKLQLDYSSGTSIESGSTGACTAPATAAAATITSTTSLSSMGGWSQPHKHPYNNTTKLSQFDGYTRNDATFNMALDLNEADNNAPIPGVRSPPDGQNDDQSSAALHHYGGATASQDYSKPAGIAASVFQTYPSKIINQNVPYSRSASTAVNYTNSTNSSQLRSSNDNVWSRYSTSSSSNLKGSSQQLTQTAISSQNCADEEKKSTGACESNIRREAIGASPSEEKSTHPINLQDGANCAVLDISVDGADLIHQSREVLSAAANGNVDSSSGGQLCRNVLDLGDTDHPSLMNEPLAGAVVCDEEQGISISRREIPGAVLDLGDGGDLPASLRNEPPQLAAAAALDLGDDHALVSRNIPGAVLDIGDAEPTGAAAAVVQRRPSEGSVDAAICDIVGDGSSGGGAVLDLVSSRPLDVIASTVGGGRATVCQRPLDIVTGACAVASPDRPELAVCQPDVVDVPQRATDGEDENHIDDSDAAQPTPSPINRHPPHLLAYLDDAVNNHLAENDDNDPHARENIPNVNDHQRLLPDLMADNNADDHHNNNEEGSHVDPAIVAENTLACHTNNEPALVQESQTCNRIPEVVNVHQSCEAGTAHTTARIDDVSAGATICDIVGGIEAFNSVCSVDAAGAGGQYNRAQEDLNDRVDQRRSTSDGVLIQVESNESNRASAGVAASQQHVQKPMPVVFDPNQAIGDDIDLEAELAELEEEQAILQGAYAVDQDIATHPVLTSVRVLVAASDASSQDHQVSEQSHVSSNKQGMQYNSDDNSSSEQSHVAATRNATLNLDVIEEASALPKSNSPKNNENVNECLSTNLLINISSTISAEAGQASEASISVDNNASKNSDACVTTNSHSTAALGGDVDSDGNTGRHQLTTQMSEEFASGQNCGEVDLLPRIAAEVCNAAAAPNAGVDSIEGNAADSAAVPSTVEASGDSAVAGDVEIYNNEAYAEDEAAYSCDAREMESPTRQTPGSLVTAVYEDAPAGGGRHDHINAATGGMNIVGTVAPFWVPDDEANNCQECGSKFTLVRRRHHCRACGRVLCAQCCRHRAPLAYMQYREARVCRTCRIMITEAEDEAGSEGVAAAGAEAAVGGYHQPQNSPRSPDPNNPMEYCSRVPPPQQGGAVDADGPAPTVMVPVGVLKREDTSSGHGGEGANRSSKQVIFSDGIRPGGDLTELDRSSPPHQPPPPHRTRAGRLAKIMPGGRRAGGGRGEVCLLPPGGGLPPVLLDRCKGQHPEYLSSDGNEELQQRLADQMAGDGPPVLFAIHNNLTVVCKLVKLECCVGVKVWSIGTRGLCGVGQEELVLLLEALPGELHPPTDVFAYFYSVYQQANKGNLVNELGHTILTEPEGFLGSREHGGFLYVRPTFQCLHNLPLPQPPFLFALLIHKWETPWAKVFPLRLLLRLGAEFRYYPCPLVSTRNRKPVFSEIGHTIMNLLVDFRNYTYTIPGIQGLVVHMEDKKTTLYIPRNRYAQVTKALGNSNDHVLALAANFSPQADSHLVTIENDDGQYSTQAINIHNRPRRVTGASFVVFNGALKSNCGLTAKSSIVEDGLMVQITGDVMTALREALRAMKDFSISCGITGEPPQEEVILQWTQDDKNFNVGVKSPIDNRAMDGVPSVKIHSGTDYISSDFLIRWTEVFIIQGESSSSGAGDVNLSRIWEGLARGFCVALTPHLPQLYADISTHLALRATIHHQDVGYEAGSGGSVLSASCLNSLDAELVPVIHRAAATVTHDPIILELFFHVLQQ
uniref:Zinc finger FYVE domain-containing protein 16-like n=1 Tax=Hirondellea gigas TaxID=1518452 RepID=A0A6A7G1P4_9CRUS